MLKNPVKRIYPKKNHTFLIDTPYNNQQPIHILYIVYQYIIYIYIDILLMEEILHQLIGSLSHYLRRVLAPSQVVSRISAINSIYNLMASLQSCSPVSIFRDIPLGFVSYGMRWQLNWSHGWSESEVCTVSWLCRCCKSASIGTNGWGMLRMLGVGFFGNSIFHWVKSVSLVKSSSPILGIYLCTTFQVYYSI